jgi:cytochrome c553
MKHKNISGLCAVVLVFGLIGGTHAAGNAEQGRAKAGTCLGCHGLSSYTNVYPTYHVPKLAGQHPDYIVAALKAYKNGERNHSTMRAQAYSLSEQDMADVAAYLSSAK